MCKITNETAKKILQNCRSIDVFEADNVDSEDLARLIADIKILTDELELYSKKAKKSLVDRGEGQIFYFSDIEKKVFISEGKSTSSYNPEDVYDEFKKNDLENKYWDIVNIKVTDAKELAKSNQTVKEILAKNEYKKVGDPYFTVAKMNKQELIENS